jgi:hypothetical protein
VAAPRRGRPGGDRRARPGDRGHQFATISADGLTLFDAAAKARRGLLALPGLNVLAWAFLPSGEIIAAGRGEIAIWDPATGRAVSWTGAPRELSFQLAVDPAGTQVAVGYHSGQVLWADLAGLRAHAPPPPATLHDRAPCADRPVAQPAFDQLVTLAP